MQKPTLDNILDLFQNGETRYDKDAYFKEAITALHAGVGPHAILDRVLKEHVILMHLHNELINKNRVAVAEVTRLAAIVLEPSANELEAEKAKVKIMEDELASYRDALQHYQK